MVDLDWFTYCHDALVSIHMTSRNCIASSHSSFPISRSLENIRWVSGWCSGVYFMPCNLFQDTCDCVRS